MTTQQVMGTSISAADLIDRILDKGVVINADIKIAVTGVELLDIRIRAAVASFETAARYGLEFPSGTKMETPVWQEAMVGKESCPQCGKRSPVEALIGGGCLWCGWLSAKAMTASGTPSGNGRHHDAISHKPRPR